jgi:hypothetical protein
MKKKFEKSVNGGKSRRGEKQSGQTARKQKTDRAEEGLGLPRAGWSNLSCVEQAIDTGREIAIAG